jgi:hypothetical protein
MALQEPLLMKIITIISHHIKNSLWSIAQLKQ